MNDILDQIDLQPAGAGPPAAGAYRWSPLQEAIFEAMKRPGNILIQAGAGCAKTTTNIEATKHAAGSSIFLAFNKAIAEDIRRKGPKGDVKTLNALGHSIMLENRPRAKLNARKMQEIVKKIMGETGEQKEYGYTLSRVCGLAKNCAFGIGETPTDAQAFIDLIDAYAFDIPFDRLSDFAHVCHEAFEQSRLDETQFDFDDQLWTPVYNGWKFPFYNNTFVDECQDLSPIQHWMLRYMVLNGEGGRIIAVGDRHQAIYGFRGASHSSMDDLKTMFDMKELPLSVSYRCAQRVVEEARQFFPELQWRDGAPQGEILWADSDPRTFTRHMIVCRTNAPLFRAILAHVRAKEPCQVLSNFLDSFQSFIRGFKATYTSDLMAKLDRWFEREREAALAKGKRGKLAGLYDRYETVKLLSGEFKFVSDMVEMVRGLGESTRGPIFATIHKSKGLEHEDVYILRPELLGGFGDLTEEQKQQEDNLHYVAITRAKNTLTYGQGQRRL
jgi:ATP-dependent DNA helicase UvrD/PcrA